ncbi:MAG: hypothetical protein QM723_38605 [Myxococcaceae bacterium]
MKTRSPWPLVLTAAVACNCGGGVTPPPPPVPPQVFLTNPLENPQIGPSLKVRVNVSGCASVKHIDLKQNKTLFLKGIDNPTVPTEIDLLPAAFNNVYNSLGISANLNLSATAICDDDRTNTSTGLGIQYFPVASKVDPGATMVTMLPDSFVAENGLGGTPTFVGCISVNDQLAIAHVDTMGLVPLFNNAIPFACSASSTITDKNTASGTRWLLDSGGVFSFDEQLNIKGGLAGAFTNIGVGPEGDLMAYTNHSTVGYSLFRIPANGPPSVPVWQTSTQQQGVLGAGSVITNPVIDTNGIAYALTWAYMIDTYTGHVQVEKYNWNNGAFVGATDIGTQSYGDLNVPVLPGAAFSRDGRIVYFAVQATGVSGRTTSSIVACSTLNPMCQLPTGAQWQSPSLDGVVIAVLPYFNDKIIAAIAPDRIFFIDGDTGLLINWMSEPLVASPGLGVMQLQPGAGRDFYMLNGSSGGYPTEVVAVDDPASGELWRLNIQGGSSPQTGITMGIDVTGQSWLRVGTAQVKPLSLSEYRAVRGNSP